MSEVEEAIIDDKHSLQSTFRENAIEHIFIAEILRGLWRRGYFDVEILRAEVDAAGYDVVVEAAGAMRHIQLKASFDGAKTSRQTVNTKLGRKPSGCVVWIVFDKDTLSLKRFLWFGQHPDEKISFEGMKKAKHTKGNAKGEKAERLSSVVITRPLFEKIDSIGVLIDRLFPSAAPPRL